MGSALQPPFYDPIRALAPELSIAETRRLSLYYSLLAICLTSIGMKELIRHEADLGSQFIGAYDTVIGVALAVAAVGLRFRTWRASRLA
jgi:hypothetical protein